MKLSEFIASLPLFHKQTGVEQIKLIGWYLHTYGGKEVFSNDDLRSAFRSSSVDPPDVTVYLPRMCQKPRQIVLKSRGGHKLTGEVRRTLDQKYLNHPVAVQTTETLRLLPSEIPDLAEREFLREAMSCYRVGAFRATIVMVWNLAYDHLTTWILNEPKRLQEFNAASLKRFPKAGVVVSLRSDFEKLKESEVIDVCNTASFYSKNITVILKEKLARRNIAAHPSDVKITQSQADDAVTDLIHNVVLKLK